MLFKLKTYGVEGDLLLLLKNYLKNRKHRVVLNSQTFEWGIVNSRVPQGLVLGLLLFPIYINYLPDGITSTSKIFADDTSLFSKEQGLDKCVNELTCDLKKVSDWS